MKRSCWVICAVLVLIVGFVGLELLAQATDPLVGTWELNIAKSKYNPGPPLKSSSRMFAAVANGLKYSGKSVKADGTILGTQWTAHFDGKDYPITGDPDTDTIAIKRIDKFTIEGTAKKAGKVTYRVKHIVSQDGKASTLTVEGTDTQGKPYNNVLVFDKK